MHARMNRSRHFLRHQDRAQREPRRQRFCKRDDIRFHAIVLECEHLARAPQTTLDLIKDQQRAALLRQVASGLEKLAADRMNATFALYRLDADSAYVIVEFLFQIFDVVKLYE